MHLLTQLVKNFKRTGVDPTKIGILQTALMPPTKRIMVTSQFIDFAQEHYHATHSGPGAWEEWILTEMRPPLWFEIALPYGTVAYFEGLNGKVHFFIQQEGKIHNIGILNEANTDHAKMLKAAADLLPYVIYAMKTLPDKVIMYEKTEIGVPKEFKSEEKERSFFNYVYIRPGVSQTSKGFTGTDKHGVRWHWVRPHTMLPHGKITPVPRKGHYRGDPKLGTVRRVLVGTT